jgi:hypothetical protein
LIAFLSVSAIFKITYTSQRELPVLSYSMPEDTECPME